MTSDPPKDPDRPNSPGADQPDVPERVYAVQVTATAKRDMARVPPRILPAIIEFLYGDLARYPRRVGKPLERELAGLFSARRGPYRILYRINDHPRASAQEHQPVVIVARIDHRSDVYRS